MEIEDNSIHEFDKELRHLLLHLHDTNAEKLQSFIEKKIKKPLKKIRAEILGKKRGEIKT